MTVSPRYDTLRAPETFFVASENTYVREPMTAYNLRNQGKCPMIDYIELPEDKRAESIVGEIYSRLNDYIRRKKEESISNVILIRTEDTMELSGLFFRMMV